ncbi:TetR/AcrR family transcriptional regulator [Brevibacillus porteri]|uniref:TetR family transcriptional regulator n=1 Tax=Brevibacillus porteri TaxID=2126350 RepID=A0ABX5FKL6_9BACL|nr:TetR/AcrR family transcriptional regulator [Brevibacillus porteri]MED1797614.1 TetR/AcrR family transcriptional regulator [Brevibacillus porteri]MED2130646.1 TetR/AcrR family transcriptional regulator [Brevibacillus porteri]MED2745092.1 TetR/AcrR family transcriptional regulator [Brevibacillus porteri]MED2815813.1 TetR/AcrR family transcriptional regulator [Brevibacillus porteri]MED2895140.1 TetR/AcrR family transcriptional regulator [Brevibacillus porteri]
MTNDKLSKGEQSRGRLLAAAASEFAVKGFHRTRVSDIVKAAGLTQASFYQYFDSKEGLYQQLTDTFATKLWELADSGQKVTVLTKADVLGQVRENLLALFRFFQEQPELTRIVLYQAEEGEELHRKLASIVAVNLRKNQSAGHVRVELSVEVAAEAMIAVVDRMTTRYLLTGEKTAEQLADDAVSFLAYGILQANE